MLASLKRLFKKEPPPPELRGTPKVRREKTYSADTGYVYQYFYEGYRAGRRGRQPGDEHVFSVTSDRTSRFPVTVFLGSAVVAEWQQGSGRELNATEHYALVKLSLFQAFDERHDLVGGAGDSAVDIEITLRDIEQHAETLDW